MTEQELAEIEARANAATPGPWDSAYGMTGTFVFEVLNEDDAHCTIAELSRFNQRNDAAFISHAREDIPALIAEVRRLRQRRCRQSDEASASCYGSI